MQLEHANIKNFRSLRNVEVDFGSHTAFIGGNGAGKSSVLKALEMFYSTSRSVDIDDYFGRDQNVAIEIELTFSSFTDEENPIWDCDIDAKNPLPAQNLSL